MRRFALSNLRDFGMGKKACENKIIEECSYLMEVLRKWKGQRLFDHYWLNINVSDFKKRNKRADISEWKLFSASLVSGEPFDTTHPINYAVSNIICSMVYGSRFEYDDPVFTSLVDRTNTLIQISGSPSVMVT